MSFGPDDFMPAILKDDSFASSLVEGSISICIPLSSKFLSIMLHIYWIYSPSVPFSYEGSEKFMKTNMWLSTFSFPLIQVSSYVNITLITYFLALLLTYYN